MAKLTNLWISGIRSFGPFDEDRQHISFSSPLTIILGQNGCGKTTIIESLKFACSGDVPDGSQRGQGFVNDPKIYSKHSVKGQIRLKMTDINDTEYFICKSVEVVQKSTNMQFSRPDNSLVIKKDGEERSISGKCADVDAHCREILGVSAPIINNVIFCHQENSGWPLEDGKKLKEKFDEIFAATMYNKCIEAMIKLVKTGRTDLKILASEVEVKKMKKFAVERELSKLLENQEKHQSLEKDITDKNKKLEPIITRLSEIHKLQMNFSQVREKLAVKESERKNVQEHQKLISKNITKEFEGSDEDLTEEINLFQTKQNQIKDRKSELEKKVNDIDKEEKRVASDIKRMQEKVGELKEVLRHFDRLKAERNSLIVKIKKEFGTNISTDFDDMADVDMTIADVREIFEASRTSFDLLKQQFDNEEVEKQHVIDEKNKRVVEIQQTQKLKQDQIRENDKKIRTINGELQSLGFANQRLEKVDEKMKSVDEDLKTLKTSSDTQKFESNIEEERKKIIQLQENLDTLNKEYKILQQNNTMESDIETQRAEIHKCESDIFNMKSKNFDNFKVLFGDDVPEIGLKESIESLLTSKQIVCDNITNKIKRKEREFAALESKLNSERQKLKEYNSELSLAKNDISSLCKDGRFQEVLEETKNLVDKLQKEKGQLSSAKIIYEKFVTDFEKEKPCCPICQTNFSNKVEATKEIIATIKAKIRGVPNELNKVEKQLKEKQELYSKLLQKKPTNEYIQVLSEEKIPQLEQLVQNMESEKQNVQEELSNYEQQLLEPRKKLDICRNVVTDAALIDQCQLGINRSKAKIESLELQLVTVPSNRSKHETELEIENVTEDIRAARQNSETLQRKLDHLKSRYNELLHEKEKLLGQKSDLQKGIQNLPQLRLQLDEITQKNTELKNELINLNCQIGPIELELKEAKKDKEATKQQNKQTCNAEQNKLSEKEKILQDIGKLQNDIKECIKKGIDLELEKALEELNKYTATGNSLAESKRKVSKTIAEIDVQQHKEESLKKSLESNVELRAKRKLERILNGEIEKIKEEIGNLDYQSIDNENQQLQKDRQLLNNSIQKTEGQKTELEQQIAAIERELRKPENREAEREYKHKYYEYVIKEQSLIDLEDYSTVLSKALIEYHKSCMTKINKSIRELWRAIYRGNDIDYIEIRTEEGEKKGFKRSYNYKVVQVKNGVELDLRGRCSAGQKVLACLIIRIALAERFSANCGILALDEPTTNLDKQNIISLSTALARIVNERQTEKNFQLIIITHDEEFLEELKSIESVEHYWLVSRNAKGNSVITRTNV